jgi:hypothetical protein
MERIEAVKITEENATDVALWCGGVVNYDMDKAQAGYKKAIKNLSFPTMTGVRIAVLDEYLVKNERGKFYTLKPHEFEKKWEKRKRPTTYVTHPEGVRARGM